MVSERTRHARWLFADIGANYDGMGALLSFGQDPRWRRFLASRVPPEATNVLDVATGTAAVAIELVGRVPGRRVVGLDQSEPMLRAGIARAFDANANGRVAFVLGQGERLPFAPATFDALTFTYLLRYVDDPAATLRGLAEVVKPGGRSRRSNSACPRARGIPYGGRTRASCFRSPAGFPRPRGTRSDGSSARASPATPADTRSRSSSIFGARPGSRRSALGG